MAFVKVYLRSLRILWAERWLSSLIAAMGIGGVAIQLVEPVFFGRVIDSLSKQKGVSQILFIWAGLSLINVALSVALAIASDRMAHRRRLSILGEVFERVIALPVSFHAEQGSGRVVRAILTGTDQLFVLWLSFLREHLPALMGVVLLVPAAFVMDWRLACLLFALAAVYLLGNSLILRRTHTGQESVEGYYQDVFGRLGDVIGNVAVVQSYSRLMDEAQALQQIMSRLLSAQYPVLTWWGLLNVVTRVSATLAMVALLGYGSWLANQGEMGVGQIVAFAGFSGLLIAKLDQLSSFFSRTITQAPTLEAFFQLLDRQDRAQESGQARPLGDVSGDIEFRGVTYRFSPLGQGVFDLCFHARPGQTVALVGPSGAGKTTTLALLQRLFDPQQGEIRLDGQNIKEFTLASLRQAIATVFQDSGLFNRSILENIRVGRPSARDDEVEEAARKAEAHEFICAKPGGYQFVIGERGSLLSGGERQRIAIARAILKNAPVLIFDEATSALDNETEKRIQAAISQLRAGKTTFVIAHRLSTVVSADLILVYERGRIIETGAFEELRNADGTFARLLRAGELAHSHGNPLGASRTEGRGPVDVGAGAPDTGAGARDVGAGAPDIGANAPDVGANALRT